MSDAPERIWAWDDRTPTERDKGWSACDAGTGATEYIRADLVPAPSVAVETIIAVADEIMSDLSGYLDGSLTADDEMEAADIVRRIIASTFSAPGWQPIETAPRDWTAILASGLDHGKEPGRHYSVVEWMDFGCESGWYPGEDAEPLTYLTHWMPLPAPPSEGVEP